jgi:hypothetical protein
VTKPRQYLPAAHESSKKFVFKAAVPKPRQHLLTKTGASSPHCASLMVESRGNTINERGVMVRLPLADPRMSALPPIATLLGHDAMSALGHKRTFLA